MPLLRRALQPSFRLVLTIALLVGPGIGLESSSQAAPTGKTTTGHPTAEKAAVEKATAEKATAEKATAEKATAEKAPAGKTPAEKAPAEQSPSIRPLTAKTPGLIMLLTDFGSRGYLLGNLKGAIYRSFPEARIDSLSNDIPKFDIDEAAQTLVLSTADYPIGTIFVVVVDPGVGGPRTPIALETQNGLIFLAPDNGVLTQVAIRYRVKRIHQIENHDVVRVNPKDSTFLSRDVLGPAAGALARGMTVAELGPAMKNIYLLTSSPAQVRDQQVFGTVSLIDGFGNLHTNVKRDQLEKIGLKEGDLLEAVFGDRHLKAKWVKTYGDVKAGEPLALVGNNEEVQLSLNQDNLAHKLEIQKGEAVVLRRP